MAGSGGNNPTNPRTVQSLEGKWLDFYALLDVSSDADSETLRKKISSTYADASANSDHRDLNRRYYYQSLMERVLPQCRRILLDPAMRARYDEQQLLHQTGDPQALDFVTFMAALQSGGKADSSGTVQAVQANEFDSLPERVRDEISIARSVMETVQSGSEFDLLPSTSLSDSAPHTGAASSPPSSAPTPMTVEPAPVVETAPPTPRPAESEIYVGAASDTAEVIADESDKRAAQQQTPLTAQTPPAVQTTPVVQTPVVQTPIATTPAAPTPVVQESAARVEPRAQVQLAPGAEGAAAPARSAEEARAAAIADSNSLNLQRAKKANTGHTPRVVVENDEPEARGNGSSKQGKHLLSPLAVNILTGIVSALLIFTILHFTDSPPPAERVPMRIVYASELKPMLELAQAEFAKTPAGTNVDLVLQPMDSRLGMRYVLSEENNAPDLWIPSESIWSRRYNQVAGKYRRREITAASPLALSPLVLIARADRAAPLKSRFPNRRIPSWEALRTAVITSSAGHFGMANPEEAGSGALSRYFMAQEWSSRHNVPWNEQAATNKSLWQWMTGFEDNVAGYKATGDMVNDLVYGTSGLYWWCLAYESEAIHWIGQGEAIEVFYLPQTYFADHPLCHIERKGTTSEVSNIRVGFERFLRTESMQRAFLKSGMRPTQIRVSTKIKDNPFTTERFTRRGIAISGFNSTGRLDYRIVNKLTAVWATRYGQ